MKKSMNALLFLILAAAMTACQSLPYQPYARDVKKKPAQGGIIALKPDHRDEDQAKAKQMMANNCASSAVKILEVVLMQTRRKMRRLQDSLVPKALVYAGLSTCSSVRTALILFVK